MGDTSLPWSEANPIIKTYSHEENYVLTIYWIFTLVTTVGYGDFVGATKVEYFITVFFMFWGVLIFSMISFLVVRVLINNFDFSVCLSEKSTQYENWLSQLEKSNNNNSIQPHLLLRIRKLLADAFLYDFNMIIEEFEIY
jgi:hypothetical protein